MEEAILRGLRVLDFTRMLAGPYATRILADFGAEVIKIQCQKTAKGAEENLTGFFNMWNRNKRSITLDLNYPEAREIVGKLTALSDVVVENFSPRVMTNWGLDYEHLRQAKPDIIMISMSSMGQTGPCKDMVAFGPTLQAISGLSYLTSFAEDHLLGLGYSLADTTSGLYGALATLAALEWRERTGQGQHVDISEYEVVFSIMGPSLLDAFANRREIRPHGNSPDYIPAAPLGCYPCAGRDRWCVIAVFNEAQWKALCRIMGGPPWTKEGRFATFLGRKQNGGILDEFLSRWTIQHPAERVEKLLQEARIPAGVVQNAEDLANDPHLLARNFYVHLNHPVLGQTITDGSPINFRENYKEKWRAAPSLGEDNHYVFKELLGLGQAEFSDYIRRGIIG